MKNISYNSCREIRNTHFVFNNFIFEFGAVYEIMWKNTVESGRPQMTIKQGACALHAGYVRLQTHTRDMQILLLFHCKSDCTNAPQCYVTRTLRVLYPPKK